MQRVVIVGTTGAGKSTLAKRLAAKLGVSCVELDALHWHTNWTPNPHFLTDVQEALTTERWVADGNYTTKKVQPFILSRADTLIWLDYSIGTKLWRLFRRTCRRVIKRETLWNGNTESLREQLFSTESIFIWLFKTHWKQRKRYEALFAEKPARLELIRCQDPRDAERVLDVALRRPHL